MNYTFDFNELISAIPVDFGRAELKLGLVVQARVVAVSELFGGLRADVVHLLKVFSFILILKE